MPRFEQIHATHRKHRTEDVYEPEVEIAPIRTGGGDESDIDELLLRIDEVLSEVTTRALGRSTGIEAA